jgi:CheY-like chemotaxis protein
MNLERTLVEKRYTVTQAAKVLGIPEEEVRSAINRSEIKAEALESLGDYVIDEYEIKRYGLSLTRSFTLEKKRVLIIEDEINFANIMRLELSRDPRIDARFATWGRDGITLAKDFKPDVLVIDFVLPDIKAPEVLKALNDDKLMDNMKVVIYSAHLQQIDPTTVEQYGSPIIDKTKGMRNIIVKVYDLLGLKTTLKAK